jgi:hypothetical protein
VVQRTDKKQAADVKTWSAPLRISFRGRHCKAGMMGDATAATRTPVCADPQTGFHLDGDRLCKCRPCSAGKPCISAGDRFRRKSAIRLDDCIGDVSIARITRARRSLRHERGGWAVPCTSAF